MLIVFISGCISQNQGEKVSNFGLLSEWCWCI